MHNASGRKTSDDSSTLRTAVRIIEQQGEGNLLYIANDDTRAAAIAATLRALSPETCTVHLPASDALPGDDSPASPANAGHRVAALRTMQSQQAKEHAAALVCVTSGEATAQLYALPDAFAGTCRAIARGDQADPAIIEAEYLEVGYVVDDRVDEPGEIAVRGAVIDIFPADSELPVRIEIVDGRVDALRTYDPGDQRTLDEIDRVEVGSAREPSPAEGVTLLAHLQPGALVEEARSAARRQSFLALAKDAARFDSAAKTIVEPARWQHDTQEWHVLDWKNDDIEPVARFVERSSPLASLHKEVEPLLERGGRLVVVGNARDLRFLRPRLARRFKRDVDHVASWRDAIGAGAIVTIEAPADAGFKTDTLMVVAAADLLGSRAITSDAGAPATSFAFEGFADLHVGDVVVHENYGLARLCGLEDMPSDDEGAADAFMLEFAGSTRRLVPTAEANRIWRYGGDGDAVTFDKLDGSTWEKRRGDIDAALAETAQALVALSREREARSVAKIEPDLARYEQFSSGFGFTETPDQARAISAIRDDLASGKPMDRLVVGDVGYGKTEVALRAAAMVALAGGQAAIAAPTTVLVRQHLTLFTRRFEGTGIAVAGLSRLSSAAEKKRVKAGLADGTIHVVVGTAAVAGKGVSYAKLQLVVVDEEQRFGAADKARLRGLHEGHVLTLSATPIPRTLQSALVGLQQMSIIATPPARRQPIRTSIASWDDALVRTALMRERGRRGQSFVVVPRIEDMAAIAARLAKVFPEGEVIEAHGKMPADDLDTAMTDFAGGKGDVLLATNIIEAGLDVPRANTMIVWRADRFGLSQLHQLRGRVGRGSRRGQILLLTDEDATIADATLKRLRTLQAFDRLGAGFEISARDLDMRGAGDLLSDSQTGHMRLIGVDLYQHLLGQALRTARGEHVDEWQPELHVGPAGSLPENWLSDADVRIQLYSRFARLTSADEIDAFEEELADRFGQLPEAVETLIASGRIRVLARHAGVARIDGGPAAIALTPRDASATDAWADAGLTNSGNRWILKEAIATIRAREERLVALLERIA